MRLARYFARYYIGATLLTLVGLIVLMVAVTLIENAGRLAAVEQEASSSALKLAAYTAAEYSVQVLPVACLLGLLISGTLLARRGELLAMQAAGVHSRDLWWAFGAVTGVAVAVGAWAGEFVVPHAVAASERVQRDEIRYVDAATRIYERRARWYLDGNRLLYLPSVDADAEVFRRPAVYELDQGAIVSVTEAQALRHGADGWWLEGARVLRLATATAQQMPRLSIPLQVSPRDLIDVTGNPRSMGFRQLRDMIDRRQVAGFDSVSHRIALHDRLAFPLSSLWMVLLALPWALRPERRRSLAVTLGGGVVFIVAELAMTQLLRLLALGHKVPVALGAWGSSGLMCLLLPASLALLARHRARGTIF